MFFNEKFCPILFQTLPSDPVTMKLFSIDFFIAFFCAHYFVAARASSSRTPVMTELAFIALMYQTKNERVHQKPYRNQSGKAYQFSTILFFVFCVTSISNILSLKTHSTSQHRQH